MGRLLKFLEKYRNTGYFLFLQLVCLLLIKSSSSFYGASFFNSSNALSGGMHTLSQNTENYFQLTKVNETLAKENAFLRNQLALLAKVSFDSLPNSKNIETAPAKVVSNTYRRGTNYLTLDVGRNDGVESGLGVLGSFGIVGQVLTSSANYSTVASILNPSVLISAEVKRTGTLCTAQWDGEDFRRISIKHIPRHITVEMGDTIVTSGFNSVYPPDELIAVVDSISLRKESPFYDIKAILATDFSSIQYAYVVKNRFRDEIDSLQSVTEETL